MLARNSASNSRATAASFAMAASIARSAAALDGTPRSVREARDLLVDERLDVLPLVSERFALGELAEAFARLDGGDGMKFAIVP